MNYAISVELQFFLISVLWGAILLLVYDFLRIIRRFIHHDIFFVALEDLIFWVIASLYIFAMIYQENNGIIRGFSVMGMAIGIVLYHYMISDILIKIITKLIRTLISPICFALKKIKRLIDFLWSRIDKSLKIVIKQLKKLNKSVKIKLKNRKQASNAKKQLHLQKKMQKREVSQKKKENKQNNKEKKNTNKKNNNKKNSNKKNKKVNKKERNNKKISKDKKLPVEKV